MRFPKAYALRERNLRYLDIVKFWTNEFLKHKIRLNYFSGEGKVPLTVSLGEAEVMFAANDEVK